MTEEEKKQYRKQYYLDNKAKAQQYYLDNIEREKERSRQYKKDNPDKINEYEAQPHIKKKRKERRKKLNQKPKTKEYNAQYQRDRKANDPLYKLSANLRNRITETFNYKGIRKPKKTEDILGCTIEEFMVYLESKFEPWMTWDNRGGQTVKGPNESWDIDHIIPISTAQTEEELIKLNHYTNLQPLCSYHNRFIKRDI
jgi:hypothetical protein